MTPAKRNHLLCLLAYGALYLLSLVVPALHRAQADIAFESMRPVIQHEDGSLEPMLMPVPIVALRHLGQLSVIVPPLLLVMIALSIWRKAFAHPAVLVCAAIGQCAFTTLYAFFLAIVYLHYAPQ